jgi:hypothetical protein
MRFILVILALSLLACQVPTDQTPILNQREIIVITSPSNPTLICATVDRVSISIPTSLGVGSESAIDATPKDNLGQPRSVDCDEKSGIVWTYNSDTCVVPDPYSFRSKVNGVRIGTCVLTATVSSVSKTGSFLVQ